MNLWKRFRQFFYNRSLHRELAAADVKRSVVNLEDATRIGILFDYYLPENEAVVFNWAEELRREGKEVELLGYVRKKETQPKEGIQTLRKSDINWAKVPVSEGARHFAHTRFDLLISCTNHPNATLEFISRISLSRWRVGPFDPLKTDCYDLMVQAEPGKNISYLITQYKHFLNQIHYDSKAA